MNIHAVQPTEDILVIYLRARWSHYEVQRVSEGHVQFKAIGDAYWSDMRVSDNPDDPDYAYYLGLAHRWDDDGRTRDPMKYW